jgi:hypothetical protein
VAKVRCRAHKHRIQRPSRLRGGPELVRVAVDLQPVQKGTEILLQHSTWWNLATAQVRSSPNHARSRVPCGQGRPRLSLRHLATQVDCVRLQMACDKCSTWFEARLSGLYTPQNQLARRCSR